jgi:uncharacterized protein (TIGR03066 family)
MIRFTGVRRLALLITVFAALLLAGCAPSVVGKWKGNVTAQGLQIPVEWEFKQDGTMAQTMSTPAGNVNISGNYKVEGSKISLKLTGMEVFGKKAPAAGMESARGDMDFKVEGEKLILTDTGKPPMTLERVKP